MFHTVLVSLILSNIQQASKSCFSGSLREVETSYNLQRMHPQYFFIFTRALSRRAQSHLTFSSPIDRMVPGLGESDLQIRSPRRGEISDNYECMEVILLSPKSLPTHTKK